MEISALTGLERAEPSLEVTLRATWTRHRCQDAPGRIASGRGTDTAAGATGDQHDPLGVLVGGPSVPARAGTAGRSPKVGRWSRHPRQPCLGFCRPPWAETPVATTKA